MRLLCALLLTTLVARADAPIEVVVPQGPARVGPVAFRPDGRVLAVCGLHHVTLWDTRTRRFLASSRPARSRAIAWSSDGQWLATGQTHSALELWNPASNQTVVLARPRPATNLGVVQVACHPAQPVLLSGNEDGQLALWNLTTRISTSVARGSAIRAVAFHPDGHQFAVARDTRYELWSWPRPQLLRTAPRPPGEGQVAFNSRGELAATQKHQLTLLGADTLKPLSTRPISGDAICSAGSRWIYSEAKQLQGFSAPVSDSLSQLAVDPSGKQLALVPEGGRQVAELCASGQPPRPLADTCTYLQDVDWAGQQLAVSTTHQAYLLRSSLHQPWRSVPAEEANLALSPDGQQVALSSSTRPSVSVVRTNSGDEIGRVSLAAQLTAVCASWSPDSRHLAVSAMPPTTSPGTTPGQLIRIDTRPWRVTSTSAAQGTLSLLSYDRDGRLLGQRWNEIYVVDSELKPGSRLASLPPMQTVNLSEHRLLQGPAFWTTNYPGRPQRTPLAHQQGGPGDSRFTLSFASEGKSQQVVTQLWDWNHPGKPTNFPSFFLHSAFSPDQSMLLATDQDGSLRLYHLPDNRLLGTLVVLDKEWAFVTPQGQYDGTPGAFQTLLLRQGRNLAPLEGLPPQYRVLDLFNKVVEGQPLPTVRLPHLQPTFRL